MAHYDRRLLVPYLQDIYSIELLCANLQQKVGESRNSLVWFQNALSQAEAIADPEPPIPPKPNHTIFAALPFALVFFFGLYFSLSNPVWIAAAVLGLIGAVLVVFNWERRDRQEKAKFEEAAQSYNKIVEANNAERKNIPNYRATIDYTTSKLPPLVAQLRAAVALRKEIYSVNVIPPKFRNIHTVSYLYEYFRTGQETDLDVLLQNLRIEEIRQRLDKTIAQNKESLLKQRRQIAMQEHQNPAQAKQQQAELQQIAMLEQNQDLQLTYQNMLAIHQKVSSFFLTVPPAPTTGK